MLHCCQKTISSNFSFRIHAHIYALKMWCVMQMIIPSVIWIWIFTIFSQIYERQFNFSSVKSVWGECNPHSPYVTLKAGPKTHGRHPTPHWAYLLVMATLLNHRLSNFENQLVCCSFRDEISAASYKHITYSTHSSGSRTTVWTRVIDILYKHASWIYIIRYMQHGNIHHWHGAGKRRL